jgi:hypothetical protein
MTHAAAESSNDRRDIARPRLSPLFDGCVARLMPVDVNLAAHLELFNVIYRDVENHVFKLSDDVVYFREHKTLLRSKQDIKADADRVRNGLALASKHAECAERLLFQLVLSHWPTLHRLRRTIWPSKPEIECGDFLRKGAL